MTPTEPRHRIESHPSAATLYLAGPLTVAAARAAVRLCENLPASVADLRVDLTAARMADASPVHALALLLARWRRSGDDRRTRMELPPPSRRPRPAVPSPRGPRATRRPRQSA